MRLNGAGETTATHVNGANVVGRRVESVFFALFVFFVVEALPALAIPVKVGDGNIAVTVPEGFEEVQPLTNEADVVRLFAHRPSVAAEPDTWLTIRQAPAANGAVESSNAEADRGVLGRYSERLHGFDVAVLQDRLTTNETVYLQSRAQLPVGAATLLVDLKSRSMEDREMKDLMRAVLASAAARPAENENRFDDWGPLFLCLALAAALIIIAAARR